MWKAGEEEEVYYLQLGEKKQKPSSCGMHKEVDWRRQHGGVVGEERLTLGSAAWVWQQAEEAFASFFPAVGCTLGESLPLQLTGQTPLLSQVIHIPRHLGHQVAGRLVLLPVLDLARPAEGEVAVGAEEPHPALGTKQQEGQTPAAHPSGSWGRAGTAQH